MKDLEESLNDIHNAFQEHQEHQEFREKECDDYWNNLSEEEREKAFYSVVKRIYSGDVEQGGSYRYVLYDVFNFGPNMYIDDSGRAYTKYLKEGERIKYSLQDDDRTLKVFIDSETWKQDL